MENTKARLALLWKNERESKEQKQKKPNKYLYWCWTACQSGLKIAGFFFFPKGNTAAYQTAGWWGETFWTSQIKRPCFYLVCWVICNAFLQPNFPISMAHKGASIAICEFNNFICPIPSIHNASSNTPAQADQPPVTLPHICRLAWAKIENLASKRCLRLKVKTVLLFSWERDMTGHVKWCTV